MSVDPRQLARGGRGAPPLTGDLARMRMMTWVVVMVTTPASLLGWLAGLAVIRRGVKPRWMLLVGTVALAGVSVVFAHNLEDLARLHFYFYGPDGFVRYFMAHEPNGLTQPELVELAARFGASWLGFMVVGVPLGVLVAAMSATLNPSEAPADLTLDGGGQMMTAQGRASALTQAMSLAVRPPDEVEPPVEGAWIGGDLPWVVSYRRVRGSWVRPPAAVEFLSRVVVGAPGVGKSRLFARNVYMAARAGHRVVFFDGKGTDPSLTELVVANYLAGFPAAQVGLYPHVPASIWRGQPRQVVQKILAVWEFAQQYEFFEAVAETGLSLAIEAPGASPVTSSEELIRRLDPNVLAKLHRANPAGGRALKEITGHGKQDLFSGFAVRMRSLLRALGRTLDGDWSWEDVDLAIVSVPTGEQKKDADATLRVLLEDFGQYATGPRRDWSRPVSLIFDEFSAMSGGRRVAINLTERLRTAQVQVTLGVQSVYGLGSKEERSRILGASPGGVYTFATPEPEELVRLVGSHTTHEQSYTGDRTTVRPVDKFKVDPNLIRRFLPGECVILQGGAFAHMFVAQTVLTGPTKAAAQATIRDAEFRQALAGLTDQPTELDPEEGTNEAATQELPG